MPVKISKPDRLEKEGVTDIDLETWKNEMLNFLHQDDDFELYTEDGIYSSWQAAEDVGMMNRIATAVAPDEKKELSKRNRQLNNYITDFAISTITSSSSTKLLVFHGYGMS